MKNCTSVCDQKFRGPVYDLLWADVRPHFQKKNPERANMEQQSFRVYQ